MPQSEHPSSASLQAIEAAALQLLHAVRSAGKGFSSPHLPAPAGGVTVPELFNEFLLSKARAGRADDYFILASANYFDASGNFSLALANVTSPGRPQSFYKLQLQ